MRQINLLTAPVPVIPPDRIFYSTKPKVALAEDGHRYFLKGPDPLVVAAEALASELAGLIGLPVPDWGLCEVPGTGLLFASQEATVRTALQLLIREGAATNPEILAQAVAFDTWIANDDRNTGNIIGQPERDGLRTRVRLQLIDFEKSRVLRGENMFLVGGMEPRHFWPREALGRLCRDLAIPVELCREIAAIKKTHVEDIMHRLAWGLSGMKLEHLESTAFQLESRAASLRQLVDEVWAYGNR